MAVTKLGRAFQVLNAALDGDPTLLERQTL
jgi:hypothetical protein